MIFEAKSFPITYIQIDTNLLSKIAFKIELV